MSFFEFLDFGEKKNKEHGSLYNSLEKMLSTYSDSEKYFFTGFAGLLGSVAYSDQEFSDQEAARIEDILRTQTSLPEDRVNTTVAILRTLTEDLAGIEDYRYTRMINNGADKELKLEILSCLFRVAAADKSVSAEEEQRIRIISENLLLTPDDFLNVRADFLKHLKVLKNMPAA